MSDVVEQEFVQTTFRDRIAGKWQIPTMIVAMLCFGAALLQFKPREERLPIKTLTSELRALQEAGLYTSAIDLANALIARGEQATKEESGTIHLHLARSLWGEASRNNALTAELADTIIEEYRIAGESGVEPDATDFATVGELFEKKREYNEAVGEYNRAITMHPPDELALRKKVIYLEANRLMAPPEKVDRLLDEFIEDSQDTLSELLWAISMRLNRYLDEGKSEEARQLLEDNATRFSGSRYVHAVEYLFYLIDYREGHYDKAERELRSLLNRIEVTGVTSAQTAWLLGQTVLADGSAQRPEEAITFFRDSIQMRASDLYSTASQLGLAEAHAMMYRYEDALHDYDDVILSLPHLQSCWVMNPDKVRTSLTNVAEILKRQGKLELSIRYLERALLLVSDSSPEEIHRWLDLLHVRENPSDEESLAALEQARLMSSPDMAEEELTWQELAIRFLNELAERLQAEKAEQASFYLERLGQTREELAYQLRRESNSLGESEDDVLKRDTLQAQARSLFVQAGEDYITLSKLNSLEEDKSAAAAWRAADYFDEAGNRLRTIDLLKAFIQERPNYSLTPRALVRLGQTYQAIGDFENAITSYKTCWDQFPRTFDAQQSLIPLTECYLAQGPGSFDLAEKALQLILQDDALFSPEAPEYRDALFLYGDLLNRLGQFEEAITQLEIALDRYPKDHRVNRALFLLADSYRQSAEGIKDDLTANPEKFIGEQENLLLERRERLEKSAILFDRLIQRYEKEGDETLEALDQLYLRLARLYQSDCLFSLQRYRDALKGYERSAWIYKDSSSCLAAYVQIINCFVHLGQINEAKAALRRAQYLTKTLPDEAFVMGEIGGTREDYRKYFEWVEYSGLLN